MHAPLAPAGQPPGEAPWRAPRRLPARTRRRGTRAGAPAVLPPAAARRWRATPRPRPRRPRQSRRPGSAARGRTARPCLWRRLALALTRRAARPRRPGWPWSRARRWRRVDRWRAGAGRWRRAVSAAVSGPVSAARRRTAGSGRSGWRAGLPPPPAVAASPPAGRVRHTVRCAHSARYASQRSSRRTGQRSAGVGIGWPSTGRCGAGLPPPRAGLPGTDEKQGVYPLHPRARASLTSRTTREKRYPARHPPEAACPQDAMRARSKAGARGGAASRRRMRW